MILINFLQYRRNYIDLFMYFMNKIKKENKKHIKINFLLTDNIDLSQIHTDIPYSIQVFGGYSPLNMLGSKRGFNDYKDKMESSLREDSEYYVTLGEDLIMNNYVWDFFIENRKILDNSQNLTLSPVINIGVPTCDFFIKDFCTQDQIQQIEKMFLQVDIQKTAGDRWSTDLSSLNKFTIENTKWQPDEFWKAVSKINFDFKGIHPIRFDQNIQKYMMDIVLNNVEKFTSKQDYELVSPWIPYLCNEVSMMKTSTLRTIQQEIGFNPYDELAINQYKQKYNLNHVFIRKGYALHTYFAFITHNVDDGYETEQKLYEELKTRIMK